MMKAFEEAIRRAGGVAALARAIGVSSPAVSQWRRRGVPAGRVLAIEHLTGVPREALRPDLYAAPARTGTGTSKARRAS